MRKNPILISAFAILGLSILGQPGIAAQIHGSTINSQAALTGKGAFTSRSGRSFRSRGRRIEREFEDGQGFARRRGVRGPNRAGRNSFGSGRHRDDWRYAAGYYGGGYGEYQGRDPYGYGAGPYSYGPEPDYGPGPGYGPQY